MVRLGNRTYRSGVFLVSLFPYIDAYGAKYFTHPNYTINLDMTYIIWDNKERN